VRASRFCVSAFLLFRTAYRVLSRVLHTVTARLRSIAVFDGSLKRSPCMMHCIVLHHRVPPGTYLTYLKVPLRYLSTLKEKDNHNTIVPALLGIEPNIN